MQTISHLTLLLSDPPRFGGVEDPSYGRYILICAGIIALVAGSGYAVRRLIGGTLKRRAAARSLRVVDVLPLGTKQRLCVVQCYDRTFLVGQGEKEVSLVAELDAVVAEQAQAETENRPSPTESFRALLEGTQAKINKAREQFANRK